MTASYECGDVLGLEVLGRTGSPDTADMAVLATVGGHLRTALASYVVQPDFNASGVSGVFLETLRQRAPYAVAEVLDYEAGRKEVLGEGPLTRRLGETAVGSTIELGPVTIGQLQRRVSELPPDHFAELAKYHGAWSKTNALGLLADIHKLSRQSETNPGWADTMYSLVREATEDPKSYTLPLDNPENLLLLCYVPSISRQLGRRLMHNNVILGLAKRTVAGDPDADENDKELLTALRTYHNAHMLQGQHWDELPLSELLRVEAALTGIARLDALVDIRRIIGSGKGERAAIAFREAEVRVDKAIQDADWASKLKLWQLMDSGHTFGRYEYWLLNDALDTRKGFTQEKSTKHGGMAAILEDNKNQMKAWKEAVRRHLPNSVHDEFCSDTPARIIGLAEHMPGGRDFVGLFLLDIQNGDDPDAGVRAAKEIIKIRLWQLKELWKNGVRKVPQTKIRVWSASRAAVEAAIADLKDYVKSLEEDGQNPPLKDILSFNGNGLSSAPVALEVRLKGIREADVPQPQ